MYTTEQVSNPLQFNFAPGDYVLATKYSDGDPGDQWCVGFYHSQLEYPKSPRHQVVNDEGVQFRGNG